MRSNERLKIGAEDALLMQEILGIQNSAPELTLPFQVPSGVAVTYDVWECYQMFCQRQGSHGKDSHNLGILHYIGEMQYKTDSADEILSGMAKEIGIGEEWLESHINQFDYNNRLNGSPNTDIRSVLSNTGMVYSVLQTTEAALKNLVDHASIAFIELGIKEVRLNGPIYGERDTVVQNTGEWGWQLFHDDVMGSTFLSYFRYNAYSNKFNVQLSQRMPYQIPEFESKFKIDNEFDDLIEATLLFEEVYGHMTNKD